MNCRKCNSKDTRVTVTEHHGNETWRYCKCLKCGTNFKTIETYAVKKRGSIPGVPQHSNCTKRGEECGLSVLTEENVRSIRLLAEMNMTYKAIADKYGIHQSTVYRIVKRKQWNHVQ